VDRLSHPSGANPTRLQLAWLVVAAATLLALGAVAFFVTAGDDEQDVASGGSSSSSSSSIETTGTFPSTTSSSSTTTPAGEAQVRDHHRHGGELVWQIGTGYFGCQDGAGGLSVERAAEQVASAPVRVLEIKRSQGAKAGLGGIVPGVKVTAEVAAIRGVPVGEDCVSPPDHTAFPDVDGLIDLVEQLADATGDGACPPTPTARP